MKITTLAPWFGSDRMIAEDIGDLMNDASPEWVGVPFAGGMSAVAYFKARSINVNDKHRHVINLARCVADVAMCSQMIARLDLLPFHPDILKAAQLRCIGREHDGGFAGHVDAQYMNKPPDLEWAIDFFTASWMARNGRAGLKDEFKASLAFRWEAGGGDSAIRFRNATGSLADWGVVMRKCTFTTLDVFEFLNRVNDKPRNGLYIDAPFNGPGDKYKHTFTVADHDRLAGALHVFQHAHIVVRYYDTSQIRRLYDEGHWDWHALEGRTQANTSAPEVLLVARRAK